MKGAANVNVSFQEQHKQLQLLVVGGSGPSLLGRDWLSQIRLNWEELHHIDQPKLTLATILDKHSKVCSKELRMTSADLLSRLPLPEAPEKVSVPADTILLMENLQASPTTATQIKTWTDRDPLLSRVRKMLLQGWRATNDQAMNPFQLRKEEMSVQDDCILWGSHVVIPLHSRQRIMFGGLEWMQNLNPKLRAVNSASRTRSLHQLCQCRPGNGQPSPGQESISTMLVQFRGKCSWSWSMHTLSGLK